MPAGLITEWCVAELVDRLLHHVPHRAHVGDALELETAMLVGLRTRRDRLGGSGRALAAAALAAAEVVDRALSASRAARIEARTAPTARCCRP